MSNFDNMEIGGFLELENFYGKEYYNNLYRFNTTRNAIKYVIKNKIYKKVYLPFYLCDCITNMFDECGINYQYYNIDSDFRPLINFDIKNDEVLLIVNYFGMYSNEEILSYSNLCNIIVDNTQAFFQKPIKDVDIVYNCRKFFGVPDGAYLNTDIDSYKYECLEYDMSNFRMEHILGRYEKSAQEYYSYFKKNDELLSKLHIRKMSRVTQNLLRGIDYFKIKEKRQSNYNYLHKFLKEINLLKNNEFNNLFMYPLMVNNGEEIRRELINNKIYIPVLWPNVLKKMPVESIEYKFANDIVLIPIDQRYDIKEMEIILNYIFKTEGVK